MKTFNITVNGTAYNVTVEETAGGAAAGQISDLHAQIPADDVRQMPQIPVQTGHHLRPRALLRAEHGSCALRTA